MSHKNVGINCEENSFTPIHQSEARHKLITINQRWITGRADLMREAESPEKLPSTSGLKFQNYVLLLKRTDRERSGPLQTHLLGSLFRCSVPFVPHADQHYSTYSSIFSPDLQPLNPAPTPQIIDTYVSSSIVFPLQLSHPIGLLGDVSATFHDGRNLTETSHRLISSPQPALSPTLTRPRASQPTPSKSTSAVLLLSPGSYPAASAQLAVTLRSLHRSEASHAKSQPQIPVAFHEPWIRCHAVSVRSFPCGWSIRHIAGTPEPCLFSPSSVFLDAQNSPL